MRIARVCNGFGILNAIVRELVDLEGEWDRWDRRVTPPDVSFSIFLYLLICLYCSILDRGIGGCVLFWSYKIGEW